jgi:hypothetical protein
MSVLPGKYGTRSSSSAKMQPTDQTSMADEQNLAPKRSSGARYLRHVGHAPSPQFES